MITTGISEESALVERRRRVEEAVHSGEMEGAFVSEQWRKDADVYIAGLIDASEFVEITRRRYGLG